MSAEQHDITCHISHVICRGSVINGPFTQWPFTKWPRTKWPWLENGQLENGHATEWPRL